MKFHIWGLYCYFVDTLNYANNHEWSSKLFHYTGNNASYNSQKLTLDISWMTKNKKKNPLGYNSIGPVNQIIV